MWDTFSDLALAPFSIPILVMQAAHPDIGAAVAHYSVYREEPWSRLFRTAFSLMRFIHGGKHGLQGRREARDLRRLHAHIKGVRPDGEEYFALSPSTFRVVPDTFLAGVIRFREEMAAPLSAKEKVRLFEEYLDLCLLFGIPRSELEEDLEQFQIHYDRLLLQTSTYNDTVAFLLEEMMRDGPRIPGVSAPWQWLYRRGLYPLIRIFTLGFLDPRFRQLHGIHWSSRDERNYRRAVAAVRAFRRFTPRWLRYSPLSVFIMLGGQGPRVISFERLKKMKGWS